MAEPVVDSFSDLDVDFELTFEDLLYSPSENLKMSGDCVGDKSSMITKRRKEIEEEDASRSYKYRRIDEEEGGASDDDDEEKRNAARLVRNRESALLSRQRKKHYVEELEEKVKSLQSVITDLNSKVSYFMSENATLRQTVVGPGWPPLVPVTTYPPWMMPFPAYHGSHRVVPLLPIPRLKPQRSAVAKVKKSEANKTKKVASVSVLGLLFCLFLFGALAPSGVFYGEYDQVRGTVLDVSVNSSSRGSDQEVGRKLLVASLFVPRNEKLVKLDGNLIIHSVSASQEDIASETRTRDMSKHLNTEKRKALSSSGFDELEDKLNSTAANGEMQQWFREGVAGPMFSSEMCTEVFQFDVSSTSGAIRSASPQPKNTTDTHKGKNNRRSLTKDQNSSHNSTIKPFSSMVVSVLTDPREEAGDGDMAGGTQSLSQVFIVVSVDGVKYVTYSCVLPRPEEVPHLVTT